MDIQIFEGPDKEGKYRYIRRWIDPAPVYCFTCGADPIKHCACYHVNHVKAQYFHAFLPANNACLGPWYSV